MSANLNQVQQLCQMMMDAEAVVQATEDLLKANKERYRYLQEEAIPTAMQELGLSSVTLETGEKLTIKQDVYASISNEDKQEVYDWLKEHGFGGLIKTEVSVAFGRDDQEKAVEFYQKLSKDGLQPDLQQGVHASTMKAFLREQIAAGTAIPLDLFGARPVWQAKLSKK